MGSVKHAMMEQGERNYQRNRYYHERQKLIDRMRLYAHAPNFVAKLKAELKTLEENWKAIRSKPKLGKTPHKLW